MQDAGVAQRRRQRLIRVVRTELRELVDGDVDDKIDARLDPRIVDVPPSLLESWRVEDQVREFSGI